MGTASSRKLQVYSSDVVEELRTLLTQKATEPAPQPASIMIGALNMLAHVLEEKGVRISSTALSGYMAKLSGPVEDAQVSGARKRGHKP